jgi:ribonuclease P protein component
VQARRARLTSRRDFNRVFTQGRKVVGRNLIVWVGRGSKRSGARLGLSVSAKLGGAVVRNRLKRLTREAFRSRRASLTAPGDLVVYLRPGCRWRRLSEAQQDLADACRKGGLLQP